MAPRGQSPLLWASLLGVLNSHNSKKALNAQDGAESEPVRVLDCGGGSGSLAVPLAIAGAKLTVVDPSIDALSTLLRRAADARVSDRITALQGEAESLTELFPEAHFDLVLAHEVLEKVVSLPDALRQIAAVLRPEGVTSLVVANPVALVIGRALIGDLRGALAALTPPVNELCTLESLVEHCRAAGLRVDSVDGIGVFSDVIPGIELERPGARTALAELEAATADLAPYRDIASRLHVMARFPAASGS